MFTREIFNKNSTNNVFFTGKRKPLLKHFPTSQGLATIRNLFNINTTYTTFSFLTSI